MFRVAKTLIVLTGILFQQLCLARQLSQVAADTPTWQSKPPTAAPLSPAAAFPATNAAAPYSSYSAASTSMPAAAVASMPAVIASNMRQALLQQPSVGQAGTRRQGLTQSAPPFIKLATAVSPNGRPAATLDPLHVDSATQTVLQASRPGWHPTTADAGMKGATNQPLAVATAAATGSADASTTSATRLAAVQAATYTPSPTTDASRISSVQLPAAPVPFGIPVIKAAGAVNIQQGRVGSGVATGLDHNWMPHLGSSHNRQPADSLAVDTSKLTLSDLLIPQSYINTALASPYNTPQPAMNKISNNTLNHTTSSAGADWVKLLHGAEKIVAKVQEGLNTSVDAGNIFKRVPGVPNVTVGVGARLSQLPNVTIGGLPLLSDLPVPGTVPGSTVGSLVSGLNAALTGLQTTVKMFQGLSYLLGIPNSALPDVGQPAVDVANDDAAFGAPIHTASSTALGSPNRAGRVAGKRGQRDTTGDNSALAVQHINRQHADQHGVQVKIEQPSNDANSSVAGTGTSKGIDSSKTAGISAIQGAALSGNSSTGSLSNQSHDAGAVNSGSSNSINGAGAAAVSSTAAARSVSTDTGSKATSPAQTAEQGATSAAGTMGGGPAASAAPRSSSRAWQVIDGKLLPMGASR